jgi:hypothetical protein
MRIEGSAHRHDLPCTMNFQLPRTVPPGTLGMSEPSDARDDTACLPPAERRRQEFEAAWDAALASPTDSPRPRIVEYLRDLSDESVAALLPARPAHRVRRPRPGRRSH